MIRVNRNFSSVRRKEFNRRKNTEIFDGKIQVISKAKFSIAGKLYRIWGIYKIGNLRICRTISCARNRNCNRFVIGNRIIECISGVSTGVN